MAEIGEHTFDATLISGGTVHAEYDEITNTIATTMHTGEDDQEFVSLFGALVTLFDVDEQEEEPW
jgi:hypothetical protein